MKHFVFNISFLLSFCFARQWSSVYSDDPSSLSCSPRKYKYDSVVCVCNATYCDTVDPVSPVPVGNFVVVTSDRNGKRFLKTQGVFEKETAIPIPDSDGAPPDGEDDAPVVLKVNQSQTYQTIFGFGGAFTDAAGININKLSAATQTNLLNAYFSNSGLEYNMGRVPMAGCDFSTRLYTYVDVVGDTNLTHFNLSFEDTLHKIPYILKAADIRGKPLKLVGSPWSAPAWMKTNNELYGQGYLFPKHYQHWANYYVKFLDAYKQAGAPIWAVTAQNEPLDGNIPGFSFNCMGWSASTQRDWIKNNLGPTLVENGYKDTKVIILDDQRPLISVWSRTVLGDPEASKYISGIGVHWYLNWLSSPKMIDDTHKAFPDKFILGTEACEGDQFWVREKVQLGSWPRAERYAKDILENLNSWYVGWLDWNLALDAGGGPNWANNYVDSPIIVNQTSDEFYKQPMFYAMGHFSKFLPEGSVRIGLEIPSRLPKNVFAGAFRRPDNGTVVIILNTSDNDVSVKVVDEARGTATISSSARSFETVLYW